jgi:Zyg-11 protein homolog
VYQQVSYNAAGVLSHMASDGVDGWTISEPKREVVLGRIVNAIDRWDLDSKRNINYRYVFESHVMCARNCYFIHSFRLFRSFEPILRLLNVDHTPECQYWAVWALANLTRVYCKLFLSKC